MTSVQVLEGVGPALEERISERYSSLEQLAHSTLLESCKIKGVDPHLILRAQQWLNENRRFDSRPLLKDVRGEVWCQWCSEGEGDGKRLNSLDTAPKNVHEQRCSSNPNAPKRFRS
jgi:hypothetical protein